MKSFNRAMMRLDKGEIAARKLFLVVLHQDYYWVVLLVLYPHAHASKSILLYSIIPIRRLI
jgi:hypothetical protein